MGVHIFDSRAIQLVTVMKRVNSVWQWRGACANSGTGGRNRCRWWTKSLGTNRIGSALL